MKLKKNKAEKRVHDATVVDGIDVTDKTKKLKLLNGANTAEVTNQDSAKEKSVKTIETSIFQHFKELTHVEEQKRMSAALQLLQQLSKTKQPEKRQKELAYALKRLIRGCGASTNISRAGFFTGLVAFLKAFGVEEISLEQIFETLEKELHVGATIANKEDADAIVGKILTCGALLHAERLADCNSEHLEKIANILLQSSKQRIYHASLGYSFLIELLEKLTLEQFESAVWPLLHKELLKPWPKQTLQTIHCLIATHKRFPSIINAKLMKAHFGGTELLNAESFPYLHKIFWQNSNTQLLTHPSFELFGAHIAGNTKLTEFWTTTVDKGLQTPTKLLEIETLKIFTDILHNLNVQQRQLVDLLTPNFMKMLVEGLKALKQKKDETLKAFYTEFLEALTACCAKLPEDAQKVAVIRRLILPPGTFNIEKYTSTRIVHQLHNTLGEAGVFEVYELYKSIFLAEIPKNPENASENWLNFERQIAGYTLQHLLAHKAVQNAHKWREQQLRFMFTCGIFHVTDAAVICKKEAAGAFSKDFGEQCRNMFYTSLQSKLNDLSVERELLLNLSRYCNEQVQQKNALKLLKVKNFDANMQQTWKRAFDAVNELDENGSGKTPKKQKKATKVEPQDKLQLVFHILLLNMALQLYREPEMAMPAIDDLLKCMQRTKEQKNKRKSKAATAETEAEPEWIEVVVDLFLHLLSQNASALRNIVNALFPHLCGNLNLSAVHQILAMLDMKDGLNPLSAKGEAASDDEEEQESETETDDDTEKAVTKHKNVTTTESDAEHEESDADSDESDEESDDDDDDDEEEIDEDANDEQITANDKLRNAISQALMENGAAVGNDDDMASIDLNDITEEEGLKLDAALANAFKALKSTTGATGGQSKKSKSHRIKTTTVMHFRIRVLDLIEIYLQQQPTLLISIEIMLALFDMLEHCVTVELKPLQIKVEKVLNKLTALKTYTADADLKETNLVDFIRLIIEKKPSVLAFDVTNRIRNKCIIFLISNSSKLADVGATTAPQVIELCEQYLLEFIKSRNPIVNITLLSDVFKLRWLGVWPLANALTQHGITLQTRTYRRIQIYEILAVLYKNNELQKLDADLSKRQLQNIEKTLLTHIKALASLAPTTKTNDSANNETVRHSPKEFQTLLELLLQVQRASERLHLQSALCNAQTCELVQELRRNIRLEATHVYQRYCAAFKLQVIRNNEVQLPESKQNGSVLDAANAGSEESESEAATENVKTQKRKQNAKDLRKLKKNKKEQRMLLASEGLNGGFAFANNNGHAAGEDESDVDM